MVKHVNAPDTEPEESNFKLPSEKEHLLQISDFWYDDKNTDIIVTKLEVVGGDEEGLSLLHRVNTDDKDKGFYYTRLFLKAIGESYKGAFDINENNFPGKQFYATIKHSKSRDGSKTYANVDQYNFSKVIEQVKITPVEQKKSDEIAWDADLK